MLFQYHIDIKCVEESSIGVHVITSRGITIRKQVQVLKLEMEYYDWLPAGLPG